MSDLGIQVSRSPGRPRHYPDQVKRWRIPARGTQQLRERLEQSAQDSGRSVSQEVETRLEQSFLGEDIHGGARLVKLFRRLGATATQIESKYSLGSFFDNYSIFMEVRKAWRKIIDDQEPPRQWEQILEFPDCGGEGEGKEPVRVTVRVLVDGPEVARLPQGTAPLHTTIRRSPPPDDKAEGSPKSAADTPELFNPTLYAVVGHLLASVESELPKIFGTNYPTLGSVIPGVDNELPQSTPLVYPELARLLATTDAELPKNPPPEDTQLRADIDNGRSKGAHE